MSMTELTIRYVLLLESLGRTSRSNLPYAVKAEAIEALEDNKRRLEREIAEELGCEDTRDLRFLEWVREVSEARRSA